MTRPPVTRRQGNPAPLYVRRPLLAGLGAVQANIEFIQAESFADRSGGIAS